MGCYFFSSHRERTVQQIPPQVKLKDGYHMCNLLSNAHYLSPGKEVEQNLSPRGCRPRSTLINLDGRLMMWHSLRVRMSPITLHT